MNSLPIDAKIKEYFPDIEFDRCDPPCKRSDMDIAFLRRLTAARMVAGVPFTLNCAYRTSAHDIARGRSGQGYHTRGRAVDIRCHDAAMRFKIVDAAIREGIFGIGIYETFVHLDDRHTPCIWYGTAKTDK